MLIKKQSDELRLKKDLGLLSSISYVAGSIIGVGIFISPQSLLKGAGGSFGVAFLLWILCGLLSYTGALCFAELGVRVKSSGGHYVYVKESYGDRVGFMFLWAQCILILPMGLSIAALATAEYILRPAFLDCPAWIPREGKRSIATAALWLVTFANCWGAKCGAIFQNIVTFTKVSALVVIIVAGIVHMSQGHLENFEGPFVTKGITVAGIGFAIYSGLYSYMGWDSLNFGYEEIKRAEKIVPVAITVGLGISVFVYLLANVAYHAVLSNNEILSGIAVGVVFGERKLGYMKWFVLPCVALSASGILNVVLFKCSRAMYTAGRCQLLPRFLSMIHIKRKTPIPALLLTALFASAVIWSNDIQAVVSTYTQINNIGYMLTISGLFRLRKLPKYRDNNELRVHTIFPVTFLVLGILLFFMSLVASPLMTFVAIGTIFIGLPIYYIFHERQFRWECLTRINDKLVRICRFGLLCEYSEKEAQ